MNPGFCYIAERTTLDRAALRVISTLGRKGIVLRNPASREITALDETGAGHLTSERDLIEGLRERSRGAFQLWFSAGVDLICGLKRLNAELVRHSYSLDGLDADERKMVVA